MGEAKRRKLAGEYPDQLTPVEAFRVPNGKLAITFDVEGVNPSSATVDAEVVVRPLRKSLRSWTSASRYHTRSWSATLAQFFADAKRRGDDDNAVQGIVWPALWTVF